MSGDVSADSEAEEVLATEWEEAEHCWFMENNNDVLSCLTAIINCTNSDQLELNNHLYNNNYNITIYYIEYLGNFQVVADSLRLSLESKESMSFQSAFDNLPSLSLDQNEQLILTNIPVN